MRKYILITVVIVVAMGTVFILATDNDDSEYSNQGPQETIVIGYMGPLSGPVSSTGIPAKNGFNLAYRDLRTDKPIRVLYEDAACDPKKAVAIAQKFLTIDNVDYVVSGVCSSSTLAISPLTQERKKVLISSVANSPDITYAGDYVFRVSAPSVGLAEATAKHLIAQGIVSVAVLTEENAYTVGWENAFFRAYTDLGGVITIRNRFSLNEKDISSQLVKMKEAESLMFLSLSSTSANALLDAYRTLGLTQVLVGNEVFGFASVLDSHAETLEGAYVATYNVDLQSGKIKNLESKYNQTFSRPWSSAYLATLGYDTYAILRDGIQKCGKDSECMKEFLYSIKDYEGMTGTFSIDENGDGVHGFVLKRVINGELK